MEDKLKLAEIKGYVECCINGVDSADRECLYYKDLNAILDIIMDKQPAIMVVEFPTDGSQVTHLEYMAKLQEEINELKHFNEHWKEVAEKFSNKNQKLHKENIELAEKLKQCEEQRNEIYYAHTGREWK